VDPASASSPKSRVIRPRPLRWHQRLLAFLAYAILEVIGATVRVRFQSSLGIESLPLHGPVIFSIWHNNLALSPVLHRDLTKERRRRALPVCQLAALVSASRDGGILSRIFENFGVQPVRGSSSRRGAQALRELTTWAKKGHDLALTPDGPRGPCYKVQSGVISLAQLTDLPIIPVAIRLQWKVRLRSWDRFQVPIPFSICEVVIAERMLVPREADEAERESLRMELENRMRAMVRD